MRDSNATLPTAASSKQLGDTSLAHKGLFIKTFGCQMNEYDSDKMAALLNHSHALERVGLPEDARVLVMNTCSVREKAAEKVFADLGRFRALKAARPGMMIAVGGCVASHSATAPPKPPITLCSSIVATTVVREKISARQSSSSVFTVCMLTT